MKFNQLFLLCIATILLSNCTDVIEPDISADTVTLIIPTDSLKTATQNQTFWWETIDHVDFYTIQIVSPNFNAPSQLITDSEVEGDKFDIILPQGEYEWKVIGHNNAYESLCEVNRLIICDTSTSLVNQSLFTTLPVSNSCINDTDYIYFEWETLSNAELYRFQIGDSDFSTLSIDTIITENSLSFIPFLEDIYYWRVRAENNTSLTFSTWAESSFTLDSTPPETPSIIFPTNIDTLQIQMQNPDFMWDFSADSHTDSLILTNDVGGVMPLFSMLGDQGSANIIDTLTVFGNDSIVDVYWFIRTYDKAGNFNENEPSLITLKK